MGIRHIYTYGNLSLPPYTETKIDAYWTFNVKRIGQRCRDSQALWGRRFSASSRGADRRWCTWTRNTSTLFAWFSCKAATMNVQRWGCWQKYRFEELWMPQLAWIHPDGSAEQDFQEYFTDSNRRPHIHYHDEPRHEIGTLKEKYERQRTCDRGVTFINHHRLSIIL